MMTWCTCTVTTCNVHGHVIRIYDLTNICKYLRNAAILRILNWQTIFFFMIRLTQMEWELLNLFDIYGSQVYMYDQGHILSIQICTFFLRWTEHNYDGKQWTTVALQSIPFNLFFINKFWNITFLEVFFFSHFWFANSCSKLKMNSFFPFTFDTKLIKTFSQKIWIQIGDKQ